MNFQRNALATLVGSLWVVIILTAVLTARLFIQSTERVELSQYEQVRKIIEFNIQGLETRALARAELVASLPVVKDLFAAGKREELAAELKQMFEIQRDKFGIDQAQFHVAPATSFLRLNAPERFGDDLRSFRPIVVAVNADHVARKGLSISRSGPGVFGVAPVTDRDGKPLGTFEFGGDFGPVLEGVKRAYGLESALFIDEARLKNAAPDLGGEVYAEKNRMGRYIKYSATNWELLRNLVNDGDLSSPAAGNEPYTRENRDTAYGVVIIPLRNPAGELLGMIVTAKDFSPTRDALGQSMIWLAMYAVFAVILLTGVALVVLRGGVARPLATLNQRFQTLAEGEAGEPIPSTDGYYGEIRTLAGHYESLRVRQAAEGVPAGAP